MNALEITALSKSFADFKLGELDLVLPGGCIMGLIGENGAGKSTTIKLILDMLRRDSGTVTLLGRDNRDNIRLTKEEIGVVFDEIGIPGCLSAAQFGKIMRLTFSNWSDEEYLRRLRELDLPKDKPFKDYSRGMKVKLGIAAAMSHGSRLLLLDEATSGLDPVARDQVLEMLLDYTRDEDHSILISSHIVSDLEKLCDYIAFLHKGKLMLCEEKDRLLEKYGIVHCNAEQFTSLPREAVIHKKENPYGIDALVLRDMLPSGVTAGMVSIEELFILMVKEAG